MCIFIRTLHCFPASVNTNLPLAVWLKILPPLNIGSILHPLNLALFQEPNPVPVKFACSLIGKCSPEVRLPMVSLNQETMIKVKSAMRDAILID